MHLSIRRLVVSMAVGLVIVTSVALTLVSALRTTAFADQAQSDLSATVDQRIDGATSGLYNIVASQGESIAQRVATDMRVAQAQLAQAGGFTVGGGSVTWDAKNQATGAVTTVTLPRANAGGTWLGQHRSAQASVPVVDATKALVGDTATVFQRMNAQGDMLRVATNILGTDGNRVIGTYIAAQGADGAKNAVLTSVLAGKTYTGSANVVGSWYVAQYLPLFDASGSQVIGMLYVGVKQESVTTLRDAVLGGKVGEHGQVLTLGTSGANKGLVRFAADAGKQGTNILDATGADGQKYVAQALDTAARLQPAQTATVRYRDGDGQPAAMRVAYYAP